MAEPGEVDSLQAGKKNILRGLEEDGLEYRNALSSGLEDKGRLWRGSPFTTKKVKCLLPYNRGREEDEPEYQNALSSGREDKGRLWPGSPFSTRKEEQSSKQQIFTRFRKCPFHEEEKKMGQSTEMPFQAGEKIRADSGHGREEDGPEYRNALSSGREDKGRLWPGSPFTSRKEEYLKVGEIVRFQMNTIFRKCPFQAGEKKMGHST
ncbi:hypothetical protein CHS0354_026677 [Potamilus streckersoni]|uniref:Uncharacterized protein n=1 Tax=Potamilus streckersoni TaxID=2493646 RepID=A0AAE0S8Y2_9BIVA|nr:hypothetical protein CHS0354_026677 [Potamilus streckersoni]